MVTRDVYVQPEAPDPVLGPDAVLAIVRRHTPRAREVTGVDETGGEARAYMIDADIVLKTQRPHRLRPRTSLAKEVFFLGQIARHPDISVPRLLGYGQDGGVEYICMTRMAGVSVRSLRLEGEQRRQVLLDLGRTLRRLHAIEQAPLLASELMPGDRAGGDFARRLESMVRQALEAFAANPAIWPLERPPEEVAAQLLKDAPASSMAVALHTNPGPEHAFVDPESALFTGLIDFGDAYIGHPAFDLRTWPRLEDRQWLLEGYQADGPVDAGFLAIWRVVSILTDMMFVALRPERREAASRNLAESVRGLGL
jgi:hygromycin-B 7''-O-kinase